MKKRVVVFNSFLEFKDRVAEAINIAETIDGMKRIWIKTMIIQDFKVVLIWAEPPAKKVEDTPPGPTSK